MSVAQQCIQARSSSTQTAYGLAPPYAGAERGFANLFTFVAVLYISTVLFPAVTNRMQLSHGRRLPNSSDGLDGQAFPGSPKTVTLTRPSSRCNTVDWPQARILTASPAPAAQPHTPDCALSRRVIRFNLLSVDISQPTFERSL